MELHVRGMCLMWVLPRSNHDWGFEKSKTSEIQ